MFQNTEGGRSGPSRESDTHNIVPIGTNIPSQFFHNYGAHSHTFSMNVS
jgi:hypothetical protein